MGRIYYIMGKSATGKDTVYKELLVRRPDLKTIVPYTTRPIREGEINGVEYHFTTNEELEELKKTGKVIELRTYQTVMGPWNYFTMDDGQFDMDGGRDHLMIGTLESYEKVKAYYGTDKVVPIYIEVDDDKRLERAIKRERKQTAPNYEEVCRRFLADQKGFSEENIAKAGIAKRFANNAEREICMDEVAAYIAEVSSLH